MLVEKANVTARAFIRLVFKGLESRLQFLDTAPVEIRRQWKSGNGVQALAVMASVACHPVSSRSICR